MAEERQSVMITDKLLTRRGWRLVSHCMLAGCGAAFLYIIINGMVTNGGDTGFGSSPWILGIEIVLSLWLMVLGAELAKSELAVN